GDPVTIETDRFIAYDPTAMKGIAGAQWVTGYVIGIFDVWGRDLAIWVPIVASVGVGAAQVSSAPPAPNPSTCTVTVQATARAGGAGVVLVGQSGQTPVGPFAFFDLVYVTVTPYATIDGSGAPGPAVSTQVRMLAHPGEFDPFIGLRPRLQPFTDLKYALRTP